ncbi:MAG: nucleic acid-binding protein [Verrucomicrobiaceae bacterium]|nr:MAG: nucleic acid-binding protein [Verrucomicrobiaceae bacterium]
MMLANIIFGSLRGKNREDLQEAADEYLVSLFKGGQISGERLLAWNGGKLNAHVMLAGPQAMAPRYHTVWGKRELTKVVELFGRVPVVKILDDHAVKKTSGWKNAPFLYLSTTWVDWESPVYRGDGKPAIPFFKLPVPDQVKEDLFGWQRSYRRLDGLWMESGELEIPTYRQLAVSDSELSKKGRELCAAIENAVGVPTYYHLFRFWSRSNDEEGRVCPSCGGGWRNPDWIDFQPFHLFYFKCDVCRLVSHLGSSPDGSRLARIGEFVPKSL